MVDEAVEEGGSEEDWEGCWDESDEDEDGLDDAWFESD